MRGGVLVLLVGLLLVPGAMGASYCPMYLSGWMNGTYYYYGPELVSMLPCGQFFTLPSTVQHSIGRNCTPSTCTDPIVTLQMLHEGVPIMPASNLKVRLAKFGGKIGHKLKRRKAGDPDGIVRDAMGKIEKEDSFLVASNDVSIVSGSDKEVFVVDGDGDKFYFRVMDVQLKYAPACDAAGNIVYTTKNLLIGQQLDVKPSEPKPTIEWNWHSSYDEFNHLIFADAEPARLYFVTTENKFEPPSR